MENNDSKDFKPYISPKDFIPEFTLKAVVLGAVFGVIFGAASVYLGLKVGLTVSASIPIAVLCHFLFSRKWARRQYLKATSFKPLEVRVNR